MSTAQCTLNGYSCFNNGWSGTDIVPIKDNSAGYPCWGYDSNGRLRYMVLSFTTPKDVGIDKSIKFTIRVFSTYSTPTMEYIISSQPPNYNGTDGGSKDPAMPSGDNVILTGQTGLPLPASVYTTTSFAVDANSLEPNTTYYLWTFVKSLTVGYCGYYTGTPWAAVMEYLPGVVYIDDGTKILTTIPYIDMGTELVQVIPYLDTGDAMVIA